jgi:hypothetical protein
VDIPMTLNNPLIITTDDTNAKVYFEQGEPIAIAFTLPRKGTEWFDLKRKDLDSITDLITRINVTSTT